MGRRIATRMETPQTAPGGWWRSHSVRLRLTLWYVGAMIAVLGVYAVAVMAFVSRSVSEALDDQLRSDLYWAAATIDDTPDGTLSGPLEDVTRLDADLPWIQVWSEDGADLLYANAEALVRPLPESRSLAASADGRIVTIPAAPVPMRVLSRPDRLYDRPVVIQVARSEGSMRTALGELRLILLLGLPLAVLAAGFGGYVVASRALAPVEQMTERARFITAERLSDRLPVENAADEMGRLALVFNETLARLQASFEQMRRFTADVSHELRTPLTAIRSVGEVGLIGHRDEAAYRGIIGSMLEEVDRLASLVDRLLTLSRAETGQQSMLTREEVDLLSLAEDVAGHLSVLAEEKGQILALEPAGRPAALGDRLVLRQALINLVDNAIKFTPAGGRITVRLFEAGGAAVIDVVDAGPGVPADLGTRIFDRFYRVPESGERGAGLGLSIARGAIEANGGRLTLEGSSPGGSTFRISMPRAVRPQRLAG
jgi:heavy metal sensor kinase